MNNCPRNLVRIIKPFLAEGYQFSVYLIKDIESHTGFIFWSGRQQLEHLIFKHESFEECARVYDILEAFYEGYCAGLKEEYQRSAQRFF